MGSIAAPRPLMRPRAIGPRCHELRVDDVVQKKEWRIIYYIGTLAIAILDVFAKSTRETPDDVIKASGGSPTCMSGRRRRARHPWRCRPTSRETIRGARSLLTSVHDWRD